MASDDNGGELDVAEMSLPGSTTGTPELEPPREIDRTWVGDSVSYRDPQWIQTLDDLGLEFPATVVDESAHATGQRTLTSLVDGSARDENHVRAQLGCQSDPGPMPGSLSSSRDPRSWRDWALDTG